jgi:Flp pilus assembly protein TadG
MTSLRRRQQAQALAWFVMVLPLFLSVIGLAIDGEAVLRAHRRAQGAADGAARTGASHIQIGRARAMPGAADVLDPVAAQQAAVDYVGSVYPDLNVKTQADERLLAVVVREPVTPTFLRLLRITTVQVEARSEARPRGGVDRPVD